MYDACPLCANDGATLYHRDRLRVYVHCAGCDLVFVPAQHHLDPAAEKAVYDQHENTVDDPGYRRFLARLHGPLTERLRPGSNGLDFGCGPGPALAQMFSQAGHTMRTYDPYYVADATVFEATYDFITLSEVAEHLANPGAELARLWHCLRPGGWLGIMTKRVKGTEAFKTWHYIGDPTHICFFSERSLGWLAGELEGEVPIFPAADVALIKKPR